MNNQELQMLLESMDPAERELSLQADDALDRLYTYKLQREFGVAIECNPGGDRTKIKVNNVIMNQEEFASWLEQKQIEKYGLEDDEEYDEDEDEFPEQANSWDYAVGYLAAHGIKVTDEFIDNDTEEEYAYGLLDDLYSYDNESLDEVIEDVLKWREEHKKEESKEKDIENDILKVVYKVVKEYLDK